MQIISFLIRILCRAPRRTRATDKEEMCSNDETELCSEFIFDKGVCEHVAQASVVLCEQLEGGRRSRQCVCVFLAPKPPRVAIHGRASDALQLGRLLRDRVAIACVPRFLSIWGTSS